jgi:hypothetical protein
MLSTKERAERVEAGEPSIPLWCDQGRFPNAQKVGRDWIVPEPDLSGFEKQKPGPQPKTKGKAQ